MLTLRQWFTEDTEFKPAVAAYKRLKYAVTVENLLLAEPILTELGFANISSYCNKLRARLEDEAVKQELGVTVTEAKISKDRQVRKRYMEIHHYFRSAIPNTILTEAMYTEWFPQEWEEQYKQWGAQFDNIFIINHLKNFKAAERYCILHDRYYKTNMWQNYMTAMEKYKQDGYTYIQRIGKSVEVIEGLLR